MRFVAERAFTVEINATKKFENIDVEDKKTVVAVTPLGRRIARVFLVGVLLETREVNENSILARVADSKGAVTVLAHSLYQPHAYATLKNANSPSYVAIVGKVRARDGFTPMIRPEFIAVVDKAEKDRWEKEAEEATRKLIEKIERDPELKKKLAESYENLDRIIEKLKTF